ncbi:HAD-IA family hydrolase [Streptomyces fructofermentans]|uniref:Haloacid dehalogenase n=1 Tax=Streptomyces fructofermentans TaxID=152141 RepID=A0A918NRY1_9ACTN|nr:HAD-IA family hydrolase [Streptomyces fructofermentans]GGX91077.1 haloacid dehalogenase [Streptomyces fructofermentans]
MRIPCEGLLFDNDGVLVDSDLGVDRAWSAWARARGLPAGQVTAMVHGRRSADTVALLVPEPGERPGALAEIDRLEIEAAATTTALPGALGLLTGLPRDRWAVVTSGVTALARARLAAAGLPLPPVLVTADDVEHGKPAPDGYLAAARSLGVDPARTVVLEDSAAGARAGAAAGAYVVGVGERGLDTDAPVVVRDLRGLLWHDGVLDLGAADVLRS